jgi:hypothetical protein
MADMGPTTTAIINGREVPVPGNFWEMSPAEQNAIVDNRALIHGVGKQPVYSGSVLPFSKNAAGETYFDPGAGLPAAIWDAAKSTFTAGGDVWTGKQPVFDPATGRTDPGLAKRAQEAAWLLSPTSPASIAGRASMLRPPTAKQLQQTGDTQFDLVRGTGAEAQGSAVSQMTNDLAAQYARQGRVGDVASEARGTVANMAPPPGTNVDTNTLLAHRETLMDAVMGPDKQNRAVAAQAIKRIDQLLADPAALTGGTISTPEIANILEQARGNWGAGQRANAITGELDRHTSGILERAQQDAAASNSGMNLDNRLRQRAKAFYGNEQNVLGYSDAELDMLHRIGSGTLPQNTLRWGSNFLGGGGGLGAQSTSAGGGILGYLTSLVSGNDPLTSTLVGSVLAPASGAGAKMTENLLARRRALAADEAIRANSPMHQRRLGMQDPATSAPGYGGELSARDSAVLRSVMPGLLAPPQNGVVTSDDPAWTPGRRLPPGYI